MIVGKHLVSTTSSVQVSSSGSVTTSLISPTPNSLVLCTVTECRTTSSNASVAPAISGCNLTWTLAASCMYDQTGSDRVSIFVYRALSSTPSAGSVTATTWGYSVDDVCISIDEFSGVHTGGTNGASAIVQSASANGSTDFPSVSLSSFTTGDAALYILGHRNTWTPESGYTSLASIASTESAGRTNIEIGYKLTEDTSINGSLTSGGLFWGLIGIELRAATVSSYLNTIDDVSQTVLPYVTATWADSRIAASANISSSSDNYIDKTTELAPTLFWKLDEPNAGVNTEIFPGTFKVKATMASVGSSPDMGLVFRWKDRNNFWLARWFGLTKLQIYKVVDGDLYNTASTWKLSKQFSSTLSNGQYLEIITTPTAITINHNGSSVGTIQDSALSEYNMYGGTFIGLWMTASTAKFDDFSITYYEGSNSAYTLQSDSFTRGNSSVIGVNTQSMTWVEVTDDVLSGTIDGYQILSNQLAGSASLDSNGMGRNKVAIAGFGGFYPDLPSTGDFVHVVDYSGNALHGFNTLGTPTTTIITDWDYSTLVGGNASVRRETNSSLNPTDDFALEAWFKTTAVTPSSYVVAKASASVAASMQYAIGLSAASVIQAQVFRGSTTITLTGPTASVGGSYHALLIVRSQQLYLIVNGTIYGPSSVGGSVNTTTGDFAVGQCGSIRSGVPSNINVQAVAFWNGITTFPTNFALTSRYLSGINTTQSDTTRYFCNAPEVLNAKNENSFTWGILGAKNTAGSVIQANGNFYLGDSNYKTKELEYGWWSRSKSASTGVFTNKEFIVAEFNTRWANAISVVTAYDYGRISSYDVGYLDSTGTWQTLSASATMSGYQATHAIGAGASIGGVFVRVNSTANGTDTARINEIIPLFTEDISNDVVSMNVNKIKENYDSTIPIGATAANSLDITLDNTDGRYNRENTASDLYGYVKPEVEFNPQLLYPDAGSVQPLGVFWADTVNTNTADMTVQFSCRDESRYLQEAELENGILYENITGGQAIANFAKIANVYNSKIDFQKSYIEQVKSLSPVFHWRLNESDLTTGMVVLNPSAASTGRQIGNLHYNKNYPYNSTFTYSKLSYDPYFSDLTELTVEFWVTDISIGVDNYTDNTSWGTASTSSLFQMTDGSVNILNIYNPSNLTTQWKTATASATGVSIQRANVNAAPETHHIAVTVDTAATGAKMIIYQNGASIWSTSSSVIGNFTTTDIGWYFGSSASTAASVSASFAEMRIWNKALTQAQIRANMNRKVSGFETAGGGDCSLVSAWGIDDDTDGDEGSETVEFIESKTYEGYWLADTVQATSAATTNYVSVDRCGILLHEDICDNARLLHNAMRKTYETSQDIFGQDGPLDNDNTNKSIIIVPSAGSAAKPLITLPINGYTDSLTKLSWSGWIKASYIPASSTYIYDGGSATGSLRLTLSSASVVVATVQGVGSVTSGATTLAGDTWCHLAVTAEKSGSTTTVKLYMDGSLIATSGNLYSANALIPTISTFGCDVTGANVWGYNTTSSVGAGYLSEISIFDYILTASQIYDLYEAGKAGKQRVYPYVWGQEQTVWDAMLQIALADFGMFYFTETGGLLIENGTRVYDTIYPQHASVQMTLNDSDYIISGSENIEIIANKINVKWHKLESLYKTERIWEAPENESVAVTSLKNTIGISDTEIYIKVKTDPQNKDIYKPYFNGSGYIKIDDEIIKFKETAKGVLKNCERGQFGTAITSHTANTIVFETKVYDIKFDSTPLMKVQPPFITAKDYGYATIEKWSTDRFTAQLVVSAYDTSKTPHYIYLNGDDPLTDLHNYLVIAGARLTIDSSEQELSETESLRQVIKLTRIAKKVEIDNQYILSKEHAREIIDFLLEHFQNGVSIINIDTMGLPHLKLSDRVKIATFDAMDIFNIEYWITEMTINYDGGVQQNMVLRRVV